jgi:hypothetical protein
MKDELYWKFCFKRFIIDPFRMPSVVKSEL